MTPTNERKNGGLLALTVEECDRVMRWFDDGDGVPFDVDDLVLLDRLREWRRRHVPEDVAVRARVNTEAMTPTHLVAQPGDRFSLCKIKDPLPSILAKHVDAHRLSRGLVVCVECAARREVL